jgi:hypothetical protein
MRSTAQIRASQAIVVVGLVALFVAGRGERVCARQASEDTRRDLQEDTFFRRRPTGKSRGAKHAPRTYRRVDPTPQPSSAPSDDAQIGVTIWQLRPSTAHDPAETRDIELGGEQRQEWTSERAGSEQEFSIGQRFRFGIETPRDGYLYVINRPVYADGAPEAAYLIFPVQGVRGGDNRVFAGRVVEFPAPSDRWLYYHVETNRPGLVAEEVIVLVTREPLELPIGEQKQRLTPEQVEEWEQHWGAPVDRFEMVGDERQARTLAEKQAAADGQPLTQTDPGPQTIYRLKVRPSEPLFLRFRIRVRGGQPDREGRSSIPATPDATPARSVTARTAGL